MDCKKRGEHAVVVGASLAGMSQAAVLSRYFEKITILESDTIDLTRAASRKGVPQDRQIHVLLNRGLVNLEKFLPGLHQDLLKSGASEIEYGRDLCWHMMGTWWSEEPSGFKGLGATRIHLEHLVRRRLLEIPNVQMRAGASVTSYLTDQSGASVHGLEYTDKFTGQALNLSADLIVDCTGRHSRTLQWLEQQGYGEIPQEEIDIDVCYTSQLVKLPESPKWKAIYIGVAPPSISRMAAIIRVEGDLYCLGIVGYFGDFPPRDSEAIKKFLESLASLELAELYPQMIPVAEQLRYRFKSSLRRYFSRAPRLPEGLLFAGDVACSFDPVYAQGMSAATISAEVIDDCLRRRRNLEGLSREYHSKQDAILNDPWMAAVSSDFRFPNVEGQRTLPIRFMMSYTALLLQAMRVPWVHDKVVPIFSLLKRPAAFFHPYLIAAALMVKLGIIRPDESRPSLLGKNQKSAARRRPEKKMEAEASR